MQESIFCPLVGESDERSFIRNLIEKPWAFIRAPYMNPNILGVIGPGFLNQVPTLGENGNLHYEAAQLEAIEPQ